MQTETSAFHHVSSSSWKKYLLQQQQQQQQDAQSVKSDKGSKKGLKSSDLKKNSNSGGSDSHRSKHKLSVVPDIEKCQQQAQQQLKHSSKGGSCESLEPNKSKGSSSSRSSSVAPATSTPPCGKQRTAPSNGYSSNKQGGRPTAQNGNSGKRGEGSDATADEVSQCCAEQRRPAAESRSGKGASKVKVCGSTQTGDPYSSPAVHSDGEYSSLGRKYPPPRQYFMTTPGPGTGLKERVYGSRSALNGSPTPLSEYGVSRAPRLSAPLRDMDNYATLDHGPYSTWMRHSPSCGTSVRGGTLTEADSMESLSSTSSSIHAQVSFLYHYFEFLTIVFIFWRKKTRTIFLIY